MLPVVILSVKFGIGYELLMEMKNGHAISCVTHAKGRQLKKNASYASYRDRAIDGSPDPTSKELAWIRTRYFHHCYHSQFRVVVVLMEEVGVVAMVH